MCVYNRNSYSFSCKMSLLYNAPTKWDKAVLHLEVVGVRENVGQRNPGLSSTIPFVSFHFDLLS